MSSANHQDGSYRAPEQAESQQTPKPYPWCLACGFHHSEDSHCDGCNGDHSAGYCMTDELAAQLASIEELRARVARAADQLFSQALQIMRSQGRQ